MLDYRLIAHNRFHIMARFCVPLWMYSDVYCMCLIGLFTPSPSTTTAKSSDDKRKRETEKRENEWERGALEGVKINAFIFFSIRTSWTNHIGTLNFISALYLVFIPFAYGCVGNFLTIISIDLLSLSWIIHSYLVLIYDCYSTISAIKWYGINQKTTRYYLDWQENFVVLDKLFLFA